MPTNVLVVEPHADLRQVIVEALSRASCDCVGVSSASDALIRLRERDYAVVLVDIDDDTPMDAVRNAVAATSARLVLITESLQTEPGSSGRQLLKPFDAKTLVDSVVR